MAKLVCTLIFLLFITSHAAHAKDLILGISSKHETLDPVYGAVAHQSFVFSTMFSPLLAVDRDASGNIIHVPRGATSWLVLNSGLRYQLFLDEAATWSDGFPVTAKDYVLAFQRIVDPGVNRFPKPDFAVESIKNAIKCANGELPPDALGVRAIDDYTLEFELETPSSYFLSTLTFGSLVPVPSHKIDELGESWADQYPVVSNGEFQLAAWAGNSLTFHARNEENKSGLDTLTFKFVREPERMFQGLLSGEVDVVIEPDARQFDWAKEYSDEIKSPTWRAPGLFYLSFNQKRPIVGDSRFSRAISLVTERDLIANATHSRPLYSLDPVAMMGADQKVPDWVLLPRTQRIEMAKRLLSQLGIDDENPYHLGVSYILGAERIMQGLVDSLNAVNIKLKGTPHTVSEAVKKGYEGDFDVILINWWMDYPDPINFYKILRSDHPHDFSRFGDPRYDTLLSQSEVELDPSKKVTLYHGLEKIISEEAPIVPLLGIDFRLLHSSRVQIDLTSEFRSSMIPEFSALRVLFVPR